MHSVILHKAGVCVIIIDVSAKTVFAVRNVNYFQMNVHKIFVNLGRGVPNAIIMELVQRMGNVSVLAVGAEQIVRILQCPHLVVLQTQIATTMVNVQMVNVYVTRVGVEDSVKFPQIRQLSVQRMLIATTTGHARMVNVYVTRVGAEKIVNMREDQKTVGSRVLEANA